MSESVPYHAVVEEIVPASNAPTTLMQWAVLILNTANPTLKVWAFLTQMQIVT